MRIIIDKCFQYYVRAVQRNIFQDWARFRNSYKEHLKFCNKVLEQNFTNVLEWSIFQIFKIYNISSILRY